MLRTVAKNAKITFLYISIFLLSCNELFVLNSRSLLPTICMVSRNQPSLLTTRESLGMVIQKGVKQRAHFTTFLFFFSGNAEYIISMCVCIHIYIYIKQTIYGIYVYIYIIWSLHAECAHIVHLLFAVVYVIL